MRNEPSIISPACLKYIQEKQAEFTDKINTELYLEAKGILNKFFGPENNQICKPTPEDADEWMIQNGLGNYNVAVLERLLPAQKKAVFTSCSVYIYFSQLTLTNSTGTTSHSIKDLWVRFKADANFVISSLSGIRSTITYPEAIIGYHHSHLPTRIPTDDTFPPRFNNFCLGTGEINQVLQVLSLKGFDKINFTLFCLHLKNYVIWESLEGTPHVCYDSVRTGVRSRQIAQGRSILPSLYDGSVARVVELLKKKITNNIIINPELRDLLIPIISNNNVEIELTDELDMYLARLITNFTTEEKREIDVDNTGRLLCYRDDQGNYTPFDRGSDTTTIREPKNPIFTFKEKPIYLKIEQISDYQTQNTNQNVYTHPSITDKFRKCFSEDFSEACFRFEEIIKKNTFRNLFQTTGSDLLPV